MKTRLFLALLLLGSGFVTPADGQGPFTVRPLSSRAGWAPRAGPSFAGATGAGPVGRRYVVFASDSTAAYAFYLPLSVRMWAEVAGFESIVVLVGGEWREQAQASTYAVIEGLADSGARVVVLDVPPGSYTLSTVAQLSRLLVSCAVDLRHDDFLLVMDVDMWPLSSAHFADAAAHLHRNASISVLMHDAFCCGSKPVNWSGFRLRNDAVDPDRDPDYYRVYAAGKGVGATVAVWQRILGGYLASVSVEAGHCHQTRDKCTAGTCTGSADPLADSGPRARTTEAQILGRVTMRLIDALLVRPLGMGKLGSANRQELELSGRYSHGQMEWELDQRVLGLALKQWGGCARHECLRIPLHPRAMLDRDHVWPPPPPPAPAEEAPAAAGMTAREDALLQGRVMVHLPMQGRGSEDGSGYGEVGWKRIVWLLDRALPLRARRGTLRKWAQAYRTQFQNGMAQEVLGCVVSIVDAQNVGHMQRLLSLVAALYGRTVYVLVYTIGLSADEMRDLQIWRNVLVAAIPTSVADQLPDVQLLRYQAVLEATAHPLLSAVRTVLYVAPHVLTCSGALELAFHRIKINPEGSFGITGQVTGHVKGHVTGHVTDAGHGSPFCLWEVQGYLVNGPFWKATQDAMEAHSMPPSPSTCEHVPAFVIPTKYVPTKYVPTKYAARGGAPDEGTGEWRSGCEVYDTVYSPLIKRGGVVLVLGHTSDVLVADMLGASRNGPARARTRARAHASTHTHTQHTHTNTQ
jgi:hypothetical protein